MERLVLGFRVGRLGLNVVVSYLLPPRDSPSGFSAKCDLRAEKAVRGVSASESS